MSRLVTGTNTVQMDEPCWSLKELIQIAPDSKSVRRYQIISVIRNGTPPPVEFRRDLGLARRFKASEFVIPGGVADEANGRIYVEHTVGELMDIADHLREGPYRAPEHPEPTDLVKEYHDSFDKRRRHAKRQSTFGYGGTVQRGS